MRFTCTFRPPTRSRLISTRNTTSRLSQSIWICVLDIYLLLYIIIGYWNYYGILQEDLSAWLLCVAEEGRFGSKELSWSEVGWNLCCYCESLARLFLRCKMILCFLSCFFSPFCFEWDFILLYHSVTMFEKPRLYWSDYIQFLNYNISVRCFFDSSNRCFHAVCISLRFVFFKGVTFLWKVAFVGAAEFLIPCWLLFPR